MSKLKDSPIFVCSAGWRSGSTMLQRIIVDTGKVLMWGESGGALNHLRLAYEAYEQMLGSGTIKYKTGYGGNGKEQFNLYQGDSRRRCDLWIASMNPPIEQFQESFKSFFETIYLRNAEKLSYQRWGVKDVMADIDTARWIKNIFPKAKFIFLIRNPLDCMLSIKRRNWIDMDDPVKALKYYALRWKKLASEFRQADFGHIVYYEKILLDKQIIDDLVSYLELPELNKNFIGTNKVDWKANNDNQLSFYEKFKIKRILGKEALVHGYD